MLPYGNNKLTSLLCSVVYVLNAPTPTAQVFVSPCVLLVFPVWILPVTVFLGIYGGVSQVSWHWSRWRKELLDPEKGFYAWFCNRLSLPDCAPYQVKHYTYLAT